MQTVRGRVTLGGYMGGVLLTTCRDTQQVGITMNAVGTGGYSAIPPC